jgi:hypothetical protein
MFLLPHYPTTPSYLAGFQIKGGFSDEKKKKIQRKHFIFESWVSLRSPGSGYTTPGSRAGGQLPHYPAVQAHRPPFPRLSRAPPTLPPGVGIYNPGVKGRRPTTPLPRAGKEKTEPPTRFFSSEARKKPKCLPAAGVEIFRIVLCT